MAKKAFTVVIEKDEDGWLVADVPELQGCHTQAKSMDELIKRVKELGMDGEEFFSKIADEKTANTEEEVLEFITNAGHPVTALEPMF